MQGSAFAFTLEYFRYRMNAPFEDSLNPDPIVQFHAWFDDAVREKVPQPDAMTLATSTPDGHPSARIVLLKSADPGGFVFVSNYRSRKGKELEANPEGTLVFHWPSLERQVRVEGVFERTSEEESDRLFAARARDHQLSSAASPQSEVITLEELDRRYAEAEKQFAGRDVRRPPHWGGYRLRPRQMEFWQHRFARMNDRVLYVWNAERAAWDRMRLAPDPHLPPIALSISFTAASSPTKTAREMTAWPMLTSSISRIAVKGTMLR